MTEHKIKTVEKNSIAEELEIEAGDVLLQINGKEIEDIHKEKLKVCVSDSFLLLLCLCTDHCNNSFNRVEKVESFAVYAYIYGVSELSVAGD